MTGLSWEHLERVHLLWGVAALVAIIAWRELARGDALSRFVSPAMRLRLATPVSTEQRVARVVAIALALTLGILALMRPQSPGTARPTSTSRIAADVVVALDVSRSMLAEDAPPNRLARARAEISAMLDELAGHRVSLVVFAGAATTLVPLTPDYGFFRMLLRSADPSSVSRGGTAIGDAIREALAAFDEDGGSASRLILLITDGEDHGSYPEEAAQEAAERGVRIVAIGLGSEEGSEIVITDPVTGVRETVRDRDGNVVISRVDGELLGSIATTTDGAYIPAEVSALDLQAIVDEHIEPMVEEAASQATRPIPDEHYPWLILGSLLALIAAVYLGAPRRYG